MTRLNALDLSSNHPVGTMKGSLRISTELNDIDISNNKAAGGLPSWIEGFEYLRSMSSLAGNEFDGNVPSQLCKLESLEYLDLSMNRFTGGIPSCDGLVQLKFLHMHGNRLNGAIPEVLARLSSLVTLDVSNNHLSGGIPRWIDQLSNFVQLWYWWYLYWDDADSAFELESSLYLRQEEVEFVVKTRNYLYKGKILSIMSELDLSYNKLAGEIPPELGELGKISALNLSYNRLSGSIPTSFAKLKSIESLDLSSNNLSGTIPCELVDLTSLEIFDVSYNNLSGQVPETGQFGTFDESNYRGNPLLCGSQLHRSCKIDESVPTENTSSEGGDSGFDMEVFLWSFGASALIVFLAVNGVLAINPYWRRAWFAFLDVKFLWWFHP